MGITRSTFVIDEDGTVVEAMRGVRPDGHAQLVLDALPDPSRGSARESPGMP